MGGAPTQRSETLLAIFEGVIEYSNEAAERDLDYRCIKLVQIFCEIQRFNYKPRCLEVSAPATGSMIVLRFVGGSNFMRHTQSMALFESNLYELVAIEVYQNIAGRREEEGEGKKANHGGRNSTRKVKFYHIAYQLRLH